MDILLKEEVRLAIDLIGYPGDFTEMFSQYQLGMLERMGHEVFFLPYSEWHLNRDETIESLHRFIHPGTQP